MQLFLLLFRCLSYFVGEFSVKVRMYQGFVTLSFYGGGRCNWIIEGGRVKFNSVFC